MDESTPELSEAENQHLLERAIEDDRQAGIAYEAEFIETIDITRPSTSNSNQRGEFQY